MNDAHIKENVMKDNDLLREFVEAIHGYWGKFPAHPTDEQENSEEYQRFCKVYDRVIEELDKS